MSSFVIPLDKLIQGNYKPLNQSIENLPNKEVIASQNDKSQTEGLGTSVGQGPAPSVIINGKYPYTAGYSQQPVKVFQGQNSIFSSNSRPCKITKRFQC